MTTPADTPRAAAAKLRELASHTLGSDNPWRYAKSIPSDSVRTAAGWEVAYGDDPKNLHYIAAMHPGVGRALADLLEDLADGDDEGVVNPWALALAEALLGEPAPQDGPVEQRCGRTACVSGADYPPCARPAGHSSAYCRSEGGDYFLASHAPQGGPMASSAPRHAPDGVSDPAPHPEPPDERAECAHCGREIENRAEPTMGWPARDNWVHVPGAFTPCWPQRGADSPRAEPKTPKENQP